MSEVTKSVFETYTKQPRVVLLMSGLGTNAEAVLSDDEIRQLYDFTAIVSDNKDSNAIQIGHNHRIPVYVNHKERFRSQSDREAYFDDLSSFLTKNNISAAIYAGFMKIATGSFCETHPGINIHPADLSIVNSDGKAKYRGMHALREMRREMGSVRSTVHVVDTPVDSGSTISLSRYAIFNECDTDEEVHTILKREEHAAFTATLKALGRGILSAASTPYNISDIERMLHD